MILRLRSSLSISCFLVLAATTPASAASDPKASAAVERMLAATGGADAPYRAKRIAFSFEVEREGKTAFSRRHVWHPATGQHSVTGKDKEGVAFAIDWNLNDRKGTATQGGAAVEGEALARLLERAWGLWVNDTYWLLMPYKLLDPGVKLAWEGEEQVGAQPCDKVKVTFDQVGLTPGDTYWVFIGKSSHRVERWQFVLQKQEPPPVAFEWSDYRSLGTLTLALRKEKVGGGQAIVFRDVEVD